MTRREHLQNLCDTLRTPDQCEFCVEWRGRGGWWAEPSEARWFDDEGEWIGADWRQAEAAMRKLLG